MDARSDTSGAPTGFQATGSHAGSSNISSQKPSPHQSNTVLLNDKQSTVSTVPNKNLAIVCDAIVGLNLEDYLLGIAQVIGPENITHASRIAGSRVCVYIATPTLLDKLLDHGALQSMMTFLFPYENMFNLLRR